MYVYKSSFHNKPKGKKTLTEKILVRSDLPSRSISHALMIIAYETSLLTGKSENVCLKLFHSVKFVFLYLRNKKVYYLMTSHILPSSTFLYPYWVTISLKILAPRQDNVKIPVFNELSHGLTLNVAFQYLVRVLMVCLN